MFVRAWVSGGCRGSRGARAWPRGWRGGVVEPWERRGPTGDKNGGYSPLPGIFVQILGEIKEKQRKASFPRLSKNQGIQGEFLRVCPRGKTGVQWVNSSVIFQVG